MHITSKCHYYYYYYQTECQWVYTTTQLKVNDAVLKNNLQKCFSTICQISQVQTFTVFNIFQVHQYFTIYRWYFLLEFEKNFMNILHNTQEVPDQFRLVKVPGIYHPLLKGLNITTKTLYIICYSF